MDSSVSVIPCLTWVRRGKAKTRPEKVSQFELQIYFPLTPAGYEIRRARKYMRRPGNESTSRENF